MFKDHLVRFCVRITAIGGAGQGAGWLLGIDDELHTILEQHWPITVVLLIFYGFWSLLVWDAERDRRQKEIEGKRKALKRRRG